MSTVQERLEETKAELELEVATAQLKALRGQDRLEETASELNLFRNGYLYDDPRMDTSTSHVGYQSRLRDRQRGRNYPVYEVEEDVAAIRGDARLLSQENEVGIGAVKTLGNFTIGTGLKYKVSLKKKTSPRGNVRLVNAVQEWIDEYVERTDWTSYEREFHERTIVDGEPYMELTPIGGGRAEPSFIEPDAITEPKDLRGTDDYFGSYALDWLFGIGTPIGRPSKPQAYFVDLSGDQQDWDVVPAERMVHGKRNVPKNCKRGVSDFFPVGDELRRADKILRNTGDGAALQSAIAWIREHPPGTTGSQVMSLGSGKTEYELDRPTLGGSTRTHRSQLYLPGTILDVRNGQQYKPGPMGSGASTYIDVSGAIQRYVGVRWAIPEFMISGDTGSTNFAAILVAESPFVKAMETEQVYFAGLYREAMWKMLGIAIRENHFASYGIESVESLKERIKIEILMPRVSVRNRLEETKIRGVLYEAGLISGPTWAAKEELDFDHEQEQRKANEPHLYDPPEQPGGDDVNAQAGGKLRKKGLDVGGADREYQPQADEPGNTNSKE